MCIFWLMSAGRAVEYVQDWWETKSLIRHRSSLWAFTVWHPSTLMNFPVFWHCFDLINKLSHCCDSAGGLFLLSNIYKIISLCLLTVPKTPGMSSFYSCSQGESEQSFKGLCCQRHAYSKESHFHVSLPCYDRQWELGFIRGFIPLQKPVIHSPTHLPLCPPHWLSPNPFPSLPPQG